MTVQKKWFREACCIHIAVNENVCDVKGNKSEPSESDAKFRYAVCTE